MIHDTRILKLSVMSLEREFETFRRELPNLLAREGKFVVVFGDKIIGTFVAFEDALAYGDDTCGLTPYLVKRIEAAKPGLFWP